MKFEMLDLLANDEEDVATTLLMLPFAFQTFTEWHDFTMQLEDEIMPILKERRVWASTGKAYKPLAKKYQ